MPNQISGRDSLHLAERSTIDRAIVVIKPKRAFLNWFKEADDNLRCVID